MTDATYTFTVNGVKFTISLKFLNFGEYNRRQVEYIVRRSGKILFHGIDLEHAHKELVGLEALDDLNVLLFRWPDDGSGAGYEIFQTYTLKQMEFARLEAEALYNEISYWLEEQGVPQ